LKTTGDVSNARQDRARIGGKEGARKSTEMRKRVKDREPFIESRQMKGICSLMRN